MTDEDLKLPFGVRRIHFVGIGGTGMNGIAEVMANLGYDVRGSDTARSATTERLERLGITIHQGQKPEHIRDAQVVVVSTAVPADNPEVVEARRLGLPVVRRAEMLAELMRFRRTICVAGSHGKTTTTSLVSTILDGAGFDPTVVNGGIIEAYGANARLGEGAWMVVEADESDGSFERLPATIAIITNIDPEHMDHWGSFDALRAGFQRFAGAIPFYGFAVACADDPEVRALMAAVPGRRFITYGFSHQADYQIAAFTQRGADLSFDLHRPDGGIIEDIQLRLPGEHMARNAAAACVTALQLGIEPERLRASLAAFAGVRRRFTRLGPAGKATVIDDYAHHPTEIAATLKAARTVAGHDRVTAILQPHRYSRLRDHFDGFCSAFDDADTVLIADVFAAGESPIEGADADALATAIAGYGHKAVARIHHWDELPKHLQAATAEPGLIVFMGAGDITKHAHAYVEAEGGSVAA